MLTFRFSGTEGVMTESEVLTSGMVGKTVALEFSADWNSLTKTLVFSNGDTTASRLVEGPVAEIPAVVLQKPLRKLTVGVYGVSSDGKLVIPTLRAEGPDIRPGVEPVWHPDPDPELPVWSQILAQIGNLEDLNTTARDNLVEAINEAAMTGGGSSAVGGLTTAVKRLLLSLLKNAVYTSNMSTVIAQLERLWSGTGDDPDEGGNSGGDGGSDNGGGSDEGGNSGGDGGTDNGGGSDEGGGSGEGGGTDDGGGSGEGGGSDDGGGSNEGGDSGDDGEDSGGTLPVSCLVTNYLINVTTSNDALAVAGGASYTATLTPASGHYIRSVQVTMGGRDITDGVYANGIIHIVSVTGDIIIRAGAEVDNAVRNYSLQDMTVVKASCSAGSDGEILLNGSPAQQSRRRTYTLASGLKCMQYGDNGSDYGEPTNYADSGYYPIPVPPTATGAVIRITPDTQYVGVMLFDYDANAGTYTRTLDSGWSMGTNSITFETRANQFMTIASKYNANGVAYITEPVALTVEFTGGVSGGDEESGDTEDQVYSVTNHLTCVTTSNNAETASAGMPYSAALTPDPGYQFASVTVMMNGVDVTQSVYADGNIQIPEVTGDIVITAFATENSDIRSYSLADLTVVKASSSIGNDGNILMNGSYVQQERRRSYVVQQGVKCCKYGDNGNYGDPTNYGDSNYYPIPVPADATAVLVKITPATQYVGLGLYDYDASNGAYTRTVDSGWCLGEKTITFSAKDCQYLTVVSKYDAAGTSYPTEASAVTVEFT